MRIFWRWLFLSLLGCNQCHATQLTVLVQPLNSVGGEPLALQPVVALTDDNGNILTGISDGTIRVVTGQAPSSYVTVQPTNNSFPFVNGIAKCSGLIINQAGKDYTLTIISLSHGVRTETSTFDVVVGPRFKLAILADISTAYGGTPFLPQPQVGVVDKGGNVVTSTKEGTVRIEIIKNPVGGLLLPGANLNVSIGVGVAKFQGVFIDVAGSPYTLRYTTSLVLDGGSTITTNPFTVANGVCNTLVLLSFPVQATSGKAFGIQPVVKLIDSGGNTLEDDSSSRIHVAISSNPSSGSLSPSYSIWGFVRRGIAVFRGLNIDKAGSDYSLVFTLYTKKAGVATWVKSRIEKISPLFNIVKGTPVALSLERNLSDGVLDGQPSDQQPIIAMVDAGGNVVDSLSAGAITVTVVPSASVTASIVVNTTMAPSLVITRVRALPTPLYPAPYGVGARLLIEVVFSDDVFVSGIPLLALSSSTTSGPSGVAECVTISTWTTSILFQYEVVLTDNTADLEYASGTALTLNGGAIIDRNKNSPNLTLPDINTATSLSGTSTVVINTTSPVIESVKSTIPGNGDYGTGEQIYIEVKFSRFVTVYGTPLLPVQLDSIGGGDAVRNAVFSSGNNTNTLVFLYVVQDGDTAANLDVVAPINRNGGYVKHYSTRPTTDADLTMVAASLSLGTSNSISIDTVIPVVDQTIGVTSLTSNGQYAPGDEIAIAVAFTKPVAVSGYPRLFLETGVIKRAAGYITGHGTKVLTFLYRVSAYDSHNMNGRVHLDIRDSDALDLNGGSITRYVARGTGGKPADISLANAMSNGKSLKNNAQIDIDGIPPAVQNVAFSSSPPPTVQRNDTVAITISFSSRVVVNATGGTPSLEMDVGEYNRQAIYTSGNKSLALTFVYTVSLGDTAPLGLDYRSVNALILNGGTIRRDSANPTLDASLTLPSRPSALMTHSIVVDRTMNAQTTIQSLTADLSVGEYGSNQLITLSLIFSDEVAIDGLPKINLNTGTSVPYISGTGTHTLIFMHIVQDNEATTSLDKVNDNSIDCALPCKIINYNGVVVNTSLAGINLLPQGIKIDTQAPTIVSVYSVTPVVQANGNSFVVGDRIDIVVEMSLDVYIDPPPSVYPEKAPLLLLNSAKYGRPVLCTGYFNSSRKLLLFQYIVQEDDVANQLAYLDTDSLTLNNGQCTIRRFSTTPKTDAILTLPPPLPILTRDSQTLNVNTTNIPTVVSVSSTTSNGLYRCGDQIELVVQFTQNVTVQGTPFLWLYLGSNRQKAAYTGGSGTTVLTFVYTVAENDYTTDLEYVDHHSLDASADGTAILHFSTNPTTLANLDLPYPLTDGSLSSNKNLTINGRKPRVVSTTFLSADGRYDVGQKVLVRVIFSSCVTVVPNSVNQSVPRLRFKPSRTTVQPIIRYGVYTSGSPGTNLSFEYTVQTGDTSSDLDYDDTTAIELNGARILTCTANPVATPPTQNVDIHLNPPGGRLLGSNSQSIVFGRALFTDLMVNRLGFRYRIEFETQYGDAILQASSYFDVLYSAGYGLRSNPSAIGDGLGACVDVDGDTLVMGAPGTKLPASAVQIVTVTGDAAAYVNEIQFVKTTAIQRPAVQVLTSTAAVGETIGGWFYLKLGTQGPTRKLYYDSDAAQVGVALEQDLGLGLETLRVTREANTYCGCRNGFVWRITFLYVEGVLPALEGVSSLTGRGASVGNERGGSFATIAVESTVIRGFFTLKLANRVTRNIDYNVDEGDLSTILTQDLGLLVRSVSRSAPSGMESYTWQITFVASDVMYDVPQLEVQTAGLRGYGASCAVYTIRDGQGRVSGSFRLQFRNDIFPNDETADISVDASDQAVESALESLGSIVDVKVARSASMNDFGGYSWTITFVKVNTKNEFGPILDTSSTLPALVAVTLVPQVGGGTTSLLNGTNARVIVEVGGYDLVPDNEGKSFWGFAGDRAGMAAVFIRAENDWKQQGGTLVGVDTREGDLFGSSVSIKGDLLLVGAPAAVSFGSFERQHFLCNADGGYFRIAFEGQQSAPIAFNAAPVANALLNAVVGVTSLSFSDVEVVVPVGATMCGQVEIEIVLKSGDIADDSGNVPELTVDTKGLTRTVGGVTVPGNAYIQEYSAGTYRTDGAEAKGLQCGAAYMFARTSRVWSQVAKLSPPPAQIADIQEYGASVSVIDTYAAIGAPGAYKEEGRVFVYQWSGGSSAWILFQTLSAAPFSKFEGDRFGHAVSISQSQPGTITLAVGAPGYSAASGAVFVFDLLDSYFQNRQLILQPSSKLAAGDRFGSSLDLDMATTFTLVVGAERNAYRDGVNSGAALVFTRRSSTDTFFTLQQVLFGSDTRRQDRFGSSVAISKDTVLIGAHENYDGKRTIRKAVQSFSTGAFGGSDGNSQLIGGLFMLGLIGANITASTAAGTGLRRIQTRTIPFDIDAASLKPILESDLPLGRVTVSREGPGADKGYTWYVTFIEATSDLPLLDIDGEYLLASVGATARVSSEWVVRVPPVLRSNAYLFTRDGAGVWTEQATLFPRGKQYFAWFGSFVALDGRTAVVGAPNLDTYVSSVNSGGGFVFDIRILSLGFSKKSYSVLEGGSIDLKVQRCSVDGGFCAIDTTNAPQLFVNYDTGDAYSDRRSANYVPVEPHVGPYQKLSMLDAVPFSAGAFYAADVVGQEPYPQVARGRWLVASHVGSATGRNQYYGSTDRRSLWIDSQFDYAGVSDYASSSDELFFDAMDMTRTFRVDTTDDMVLEVPDETIVARLSLPGIWPSAKGRLWSTITITDNGDGGSGTRSSLEFLTADDDHVQSYSHFGAAVAIFDDGNMAIVGAPLETTPAGITRTAVDCGAAYIYVRRSGFWELDERVTPSTCSPAMRFGASVGIDGSLGTIRVIVGAPGAPAAFIYRRDVVNGIVSWAEEIRLSDAAATSVAHNFGGSHSVGIFGDIAVVGASGLERAFVYHHGLANWELATVLRSGDRRVVRVLQEDVEQTYAFGHAVALDGRTVAIGAPFSDGGAFSAEEYHDRRFDRSYFGAGAVYVYHLPAQAQTVALRTDAPLVSGSFCLAVTYRGVTATSRPIYYNSTAAFVQAAVQELGAIRLVETSRTGSVEQGFTWGVTFVGEVLQVPLLTATWLGNDCAGCDPFSSSYQADPARQVLVSEKRSLGAWAQQGRLVAPDGNAGDQFGASVALSGEQVVVGAARSSALTTTSWDFETGDLTGWQTTGTAFDVQPTFGDNARARTNDYGALGPRSEGAGPRAGHEGRYWVGTFEARAGAGKTTAEIGTCSFASDALCRADDYTLPGLTAAGTTQGDGPQGTLTSQAFVIRGPWLSFRVGGGCDDRVLFVELLVDGASVRRTTGQCMETMRVVVWALHAEWQQRPARLRVVDASSSDFWGHLNFDDVRFAWDSVEQAAMTLAGAAYTFRRHAPVSRDSCVAMDRSACEWEFQSRLIASDLRSEDLFGWRVAVDEASGLAAVAAPGQHAVDANNSALVDGAGNELAEVGSVYMFRRIDEVRDGKGQLLAPPRWEPSETFKLQFPRKQAQARMGSALAMDGRSLLVGAPWKSPTPVTPFAGQAFVYDAALATVAFTASEFSCLEGNTDRVVSLTLARSGGNMSEPLTIGFATEDRSAVGVDALKFAACMKIPATERRDCFDYQQLAGELTFAAGETAKQLLVPVVDDTCHEPWAERFVVRLHVPGGEPLLGERFVAAVRIDDDDFASDMC